MHGGAMWLVACGCGADDAFDTYGEARRWQDAHEGACEGRTDLWAPEAPPGAWAPPEAGALAPLAAAPQALGLARA